MKYCIPSKLSCAVFCFLVPSLAVSAQYRAADYDSLVKQIEVKGIASVMVTLDSAYTSLFDLKEHTSDIKEEMSQKAQALLDQLGIDSEPIGYWENGIGQMGFYVDAKGLEGLIKTDKAKAFSSDNTRINRIRAYSADGSLDQVEIAISAKGFAVVEVFLNVDEIDYSIERAGVVYSHIPDFSEKIQTRINRILKKVPSINLHKSNELIPGKPSFIAKIDRDAFYTLRESKDVRAIRPINFKDSRRTKWDAEAL